MASMRASQWQRAAPVPLAIRAGWGMTLLIAPGPVLRLFGGADEGRAPRRVMRVLGARHIVQAGAEYRFGGRAREIGIGVDLLHGTTSVALRRREARPGGVRRSLTQAWRPVSLCSVSPTNSRHDSLTDSGTTCRVPESYLGAAGRRRVGRNHVAPYPMPPDRRCARILCPYHRFPEILIGTDAERRTLVGVLDGVEAVVQPANPQNHHCSELSHQPLDSSFFISTSSTAATRWEVS